MKNMYYAVLCLAILSVGSVVHGDGWRVLTQQFDCNSVSSLQLIKYSGIWIKLTLHLIKYVQEPIHTAHILMLNNTHVMPMACFLNKVRSFLLCLLSFCIHFYFRLQILEPISVLRLHYCLPHPCWSVLRLLPEQCCCSEICYLCPHSLHSIQR